MSTIVLVDGPNLANDVGRYLTDVEPSDAPAEVQARYFREWFDIDRLVSATIQLLHPGDGLGTIIVHSPKGIGREGTPYKISDREALDSFWARQGGARHTSALRVNLPGSSEKGVDTTIVVYLFETIDQWSSAYLFTNDVDFVPAVWSLRRRGKRVYCASYVEDEAKPLVQACQNFYPLNVEFLRNDRDTFEALGSGSLFGQFIAKGTRENPVRVQIVNGGLILDLPASISDADARLFASAQAKGRLTVGYLPERSQIAVSVPEENRHLLVEGIRRHYATALADSAWASCVDP